MRKTITHLVCQHLEMISRKALERYQDINAVLTGRIIARQRDRITREWKYLLRGQTLSETSVIVVLKLSPTGKAAILTVYKEQKR